MNRKSHHFLRLFFTGMAVVLFGCTTLMGAPSVISPDTVSAAESAHVEPTATLEPQPADDSSSGKRYTYRDMVAGFLQTGPEGGWRKANSESFKETAAELGILLKFHQSNNDYQDQKAAFRDYIDDAEINVIVLAALESTGWDNLLRDAKEAGKVVVIEDRRIDAPEDLYATYVGSDFTEEGRKAADAMCQLLDGSSKKNVVELVGNVGSSAARYRGQGFRENMGKCGITITQSETANWSAAEGEQVMRGFLNKSADIQGVFAQNDEMAIGAITAIQDAGMDPGADIKLVSVDGTYGAFKAMVDGDLNVTVECSPWLAPQVFEAALMALNGEDLPKWIPSREEVFWAEDAAGIIGSRRY
ncbi:MAG: ABC transporter substrate-binding protein [Anaerolineales bacterium]|nr:ABC transporter substrate-binding protein [Anaerolineales bacterium]